jgi:hypothetical protein
MTNHENMGSNNAKTNDEKLLRTNKTQRTIQAHELRYNYRKRNQAKPFSTSHEAALRLTDIDFIFPNDHNNFTKHLYTIFSLKIRSPVHYREIYRFAPTALHLYMHTDMDGSRICDDGSSQWYTVAFDNTFEWGNLYFFELVVEAMHYCKFIMIGVCSPDSYPYNGCLSSRFYANHYPSVIVGARLGFIFDLRATDADGNLYVFINGISQGIATTIARSLGDKMVPVISLACGGNKVRVDNDAEFPQCWEDSK